MGSLPSVLHDEVPARTFRAINPQVEPLELDQDRPSRFHLASLSARFCSFFGVVHCEQRFGATGRSRVIEPSSDLRLEQLSKTQVAIIARLRLALFYFQANAEKILQTPLNVGRPRCPPR